MSRPLCCFATVIAAAACLSWDSVACAEEPLRAVIPGGPTVELLAITGWPAGKSGWWDASGARMPRLQGAVERLGKLDAPPDGEMLRTFVIRIPGLDEADHQTIDWSIQVLDGGPPAEVRQSSGGWLGVKRTADEYVPDVNAIVHQMPVGTVGALRIEIGLKPFEVVSESPAAGGDGNGEVKASFRSGERDGAAFVTVTHPIDSQTHKSAVVAVDGRGTEHRSFGSSDDAGRVHTWYFRLLLSEVKGFRLKALPYSVAVFNDIALRPRPKGEPALIPSVSVTGEQPLQR